MARCFSRSNGDSRTRCVVHGAPLVALALLATLAAAPPARAEGAQQAPPAANTTPAEAFEPVHARAVNAYIARLEVLADWCHQRNLFAERDRVWRGILELDGENMTARKGLKYSRTKDGKWQDPTPRKVDNLDKKALEEMPTQRAQAVTEFKNTLVPLLDADKQLVDARRTVLRQVLVCDPDDAWVHAERGEARFGDTWVLAETARGRTRRTEIRSAAQEALAQAGKARPMTPTDDDRSFKIAWTSALETNKVRVLSTGQEAEAQRAVTIADAAAPFLRSTLGMQTDHQPGLTLYLLTNHEQETFLAGLPTLDSGLREFLRNCVGFMVPKQPRIVYWDRDDLHRIDGCVRWSVNDLLFRTYGVSMSEGWAWEGFGLYLTRELVGTRLTWSVQLKGGGRYDKLRSRLMVVDANWMNECLKVLESNDHPKLALSLAKDVNAMGVEDVLYGYTLAAYLLEGRPGMVPDVLLRIGTGKESSASALTAVLKLSIPELEERLFRWLTERK